MGEKVCLHVANRSVLEMNFDHHSTSPRHAFQTNKSDTESVPLFSIHVGAGHARLGGRGGEGGEGEEGRGGEGEEGGEGGWPGNEAAPLVLIPT